MRKSLLILGLLAVALPQLMASPEDAAILAAAESYLTANATVTTKVKFIVERVDGDLARVRINPEEKPAQRYGLDFPPEKRRQMDRSRL